MSPNVEYFAPWWGSNFSKTMPKAQWDKLSDHGKEICRNIVLKEGEIPPQLAEHDHEGKTVPSKL